jgi:hypothetical protein
VSEKLLRQFVTNLETTVLTNGDAAGSRPAETGSTNPTSAETSAGPSDTSSAGTASAGTPADASPDAAPTARAATEPGVRKVESAPVEPIDLLETAGAPMLKRLAPLLGGIIVVLVVWRLVRRRR